MRLEGVVKNGVVVLEGGCSLAEGTPVEVVVKSELAKEAPRPTHAALLELAGTVTDLPSDMARNHDHYIHGAPKR
ncbi:MAG: hypothetical protein L0Z62_13175 [Gemmataceae bacterium]|nr:hypothetical protein [Gemmataceae bacterium]